MILKKVCYYNNKLTVHFAIVEYVLDSRAYVVLAPRSSFCLPARGEMPHAKLSHCGQWQITYLINKNVRNDRQIVIVARHGFSEGQIAMLLHGFRNRRAQ